MHTRRRHRNQFHRLLLEHRLFASCTAAELDVVARNSTLHTIASGTVLMRQGDVGREFVVLLSGTVTVIVDGEEVARAGPGDFVGEVALLDHEARTATVVADTDLEVLVTGIPEFAEVLLGAPHVGRAILRAMAERVRHSDRRLVAAG